MTTKSALYFVSALLFILSINAEVVKFRQCPSSPDQNNSTTSADDCVVDEVRIEPCKEAENDKPCKVKRGLNATIQFDYTANFEGDKLIQKAYWTNQVADLPFLGLNSDGCLATNCPVIPGKKDSYSFNIFIEKAYPARQFDVKWRLRNEKQQECCFIFQIKIVP